MSADFSDEIAAIKARYAEFEAEDAYRTVWAPFASEEADVRARQLLVFSALMQEAGFQNLEGMQILDLGCGSGRHLRQFLDMGAALENLHGIDLDDAAVARGNRMSPELDIKIAGGDSIDFPSDHFDLVTHHYVFSSVPSEDLRRRLMAEVRRVLKPGGYFFWWDMRVMATAAGGESTPLDFAQLIHEPPIAQVDAAMTPRPSETLRPLPLLRKLLGPIVDRLGNETRFQAALFRFP